MTTAPGSVNQRRNHRRRLLPGRELRGGERVDADQLHRALATVTYPTTSARTAAASRAGVRAQLRVQPFTIRADHR